MKKKLLLNAIAVFIGILISVIAIEIVLRVQNFVQLDVFTMNFPGTRSCTMGKVLLLSRILEKTAKTEK